MNALKPATPKVTVKGFETYEPGYLHMDMKYLPQVREEIRRLYLFVAIDQARRWLFVSLKSNKIAASARAFLKALQQVCPIRIAKLRIDNGKELTDRLFVSASPAASMSSTNCARRWTSNSA